MTKKKGNRATVTKETVLTLDARDRHGVSDLHSPVSWRNNVIFTLPCNYTWISATKEKLRGQWAHLMGQGNVL